MTHPTRRGRVFLASVPTWMILSSVVVVVVGLITVGVVSAANRAGDDPTQKRLQAWTADLRGEQPMDPDDRATLEAELVVTDDGPITRYGLASPTSGVCWVVHVHDSGAVAGPLPGDPRQCSTPRSEPPAP